MRSVRQCLDLNQACGSLACLKYFGWCHYKDREELLGSKFISSSKPLKERVQVTKKIGYRIIKSIDLVSAPLDYIINNSKFKKL